MSSFFDNKSIFGIKTLDLFQFAVLNPQIAMLSYLKVAQEMVTQPKKLEEAQQDLLNRLMKLQNDFIKELCNDDNDSNDCIDMKYNKKNRQFEKISFENHPTVRFAQQFHDMMSSWMLDTLSSFNDINPKNASTARFFMKQYIDMMSPNNFPFLNPSFWQKTMDTCGENVKSGIEMLINDIGNGAITTNDRSKFKIGENIATTPGKVIYQNDIIELIQYLPTTERVFTKPILFVPPWINKFYILDLTSESSLVKWAVDNGFTVFMISWVNPDKRHRDRGFGNYMFDGLIEAIDKIYEGTKAKSLHTFGYCVGGTLISAMLAYLANPFCKRRPKAKIDTATLLTTLLDFERAGDMAIFMAENYLEAINAQMGNAGYMDGQIMFNTFSALKANDMIWRYFVNSYMLGQKPIAHEILYWNSDPTNITEAMQKFLSVDMYRDNLLKTGKLEIFGVPINLGKITTPIYMVSMKKDHLVPWEATFDGMKLFSSKIRFVLGGSGHVAGSINPPNKNKYCYWINENNVNSTEEWIKTATEIAGSWWNDWLEWIKPMAGNLIAPKLISEFIRNAPGIYVNNKFSDS